MHFLWLPKSFILWLYFIRVSLFELTEKENLCLYGFPNEQWEVNLPADEVPPELPEPALGINFARDGMKEKDWLSLVAVHSDTWLISVAFYFGSRFGFDKADRFAPFSNTHFGNLKMQDYSIVFFPVGTSLLIWNLI